MSFAPYSNDNRGDKPMILGFFREADYNHSFEFADRGNFFPADVHPEMPHVIFVGAFGEEVRLAHVKKTVLTMVNSDDVVEKWMIKGQREYAK